jgi:hypothetical protein
MLFVSMAGKVSKQIRSMGERLGWTPIEEVKSLELTSIEIEGRQITPVRRAGNGVGHENATPYLIP